MRLPSPRLAGVFLLLLPVLQGASEAPAFPRPLSSYQAVDGASLVDTLVARIQAEPSNLAATIVFLLAILHTFATAKFRHWAHAAEEAHRSRVSARVAPPTGDGEADGLPAEVSFKGQILHFLGEVEAVFGLWVVVLAGVITYYHGWGTVLAYIGHGVNFTEPMFVVVIMAIASTRPVLSFAERCMRLLAGLGGGSVAAWWLALLIAGPLLGSFITEPAAMTITALLLARQFYVHGPSPRLAYATLGLLFVNVSVGGTLTHFAAPPVLMVAGPWRWDTPFMLAHFGWKAAIGVAGAAVLYWAFFRAEFSRLEAVRRAAPAEGRGGPGCPGGSPGSILASWP